jgi:citrate lyase subunit beta / citryl-CoA lyase
MLYRSYLFVPGNSTNIINKAINSPADAIIIDLEDAVALSHKDVARTQVKDYLQRNTFVKPIYIRINDENTPFWEDDLAAAVSTSVKGIVLPKAENSRAVGKVCETFKQMNSDLSGDKHFEIIPLIETAKGVESVFDIASAHPAISRIAFGY